VLPANEISLPLEELSAEHQGEAETEEHDSKKITIITIIRVLQSTVHLMGSRFCCSKDHKCAVPQNQGQLVIIINDCRKDMAMVPPLP
jgi:hypothetical protein